MRRRPDKKPNVRVIAHNFRQSRPGLGREAVEAAIRDVLRESPKLCGPALKERVAERLQKPKQ